MPAISRSNHRQGPRVVPLALPKSRRNRNPTSWLGAAGTDNQGRRPQSSAGNGCTAAWPSRRAAVAPGRRLASLEGAVRCCDGIMPMQDERLLTFNKTAARLAIRRIDLHRHLNKLLARGLDMRIVGKSRRFTEASVDRLIASDEKPCEWLI